MTDWTIALIPGHLRSSRSVPARDLAGLAGLPDIAHSYAGSMRRLITDWEAMRQVAGAATAHKWSSDDLKPGADLASKLYRERRNEECLVLSRLLLQAASSAGHKANSAAERIAGIPFVLVASDLLRVFPVGPIFVAARTLTDSWLANERVAPIETDKRESDPEGTNRFVVSLSLALKTRAFLWSNERTISWWSRPADWVQVLQSKIDPHVLQTRYEDLAIPNPAAEFQLALEYARTAGGLATGVRRAQFVVDEVTIERAMGDAAPSTRTEQRGRLRDALDLLYEAKVPALEIVWPRQLMDHLGGIQERDRQIPVNDRPLVKRHLSDGPSGAIREFVAASWLALRLGRRPEAALLSRQLIALDLTGASSEEVTRALDAAIHGLGSESISCEAATAAGVTLDATGELPTLPVRSGYLHLAQHCLTFGAATALLNSPAIDDVPEGANPLLRAYVLGKAAITVADDPNAQPGERVRCTLEALRHETTLNREGAASQLGQLLTRLLSEFPSIIPDALLQLRDLVEPMWLAFGETAIELMAKVGSVTAHAIRYGHEWPDIPNPMRLIHLHSTLFKGPLTSATIRCAGAIDPTPPKNSPDHQEAPAVTKESLVSDESIEAEALALAYASPLDLLGGHSELDRQRNAAMLADRNFERQLYSGRVGRGRAIGWSEVVDLLDERTVIVDLFDGPIPPDGSLATFVSTYSRHQGWRDCQTGTWARGVLTQGDFNNPGRVLEFHEGAQELAHLRRIICEDPGRRRPVARAAYPALYDTVAAIIGPAVARYAPDGCDKVCIWPHTIHHYAPLHLLASMPGVPPPEYAILADQYTVTVITSAESLRPRQQKARREPRLPLLVAGSPTGGRLAGLAEIPELREQSKAVAMAVPGALLLPPGAATPKQLGRFMPHSRYVHLAAHGVSDPYAPFNQTIYFDGADGALTSRDLLRMDLTGTELVTLSACETAIGRFDRIDDQKGIVAALLAAGVRAVIACLWPVRPAPAACFFVSLYTSLAAGHGDDMRDAFRSAQIAARTAFPAYRDWGVFVYVGGW